jgi:hypothetical protein
MYRTPAKIPALLQADNMTSSQYVLVRKGYTRGPLADENALKLF